MRKHKIPLEKVQEAFNAAIKRRDGRCMVRDYEPCDGELECSHFFTTGACPALRFYPANAFAQCHKHHHYHHTRWSESDEYSYRKYLLDEYPANLEWMEMHKHRYIKYTDELKAEIIRLCNEDRMDDLKILIEKELEK